MSLYLFEVNDYILSSKKQSFINNALNIARELEYDNMDFITFDRIYLKDFDLKNINKNDLDLEKSLVYAQDNEVYIDLVGKGTYEGLYVCHINYGTKNAVVQEYPCNISIDGIIYIKFDIDLDGGHSSQEFSEQYAVDDYLTLEIPTKDDYTFAGWNTKQDGTGISYAAGGQYTADQN